MVLKKRNWWREGVGYQIWPASFKDTNGDGFGDLKGIISKLDYIHDLGVEFIWVSPCYDSPRHDMGYDIRNYEDIDKDYGTLQDMDDLIRGLHDRGMKLCLDLVINHTSDEHKWFQESRLNKTNNKADWYIWKDPKIVDGQKTEPNNWGSIFGGSAWKYEPARDQYYLHLFLDSQPDLNWELPEVRQALYKTAIRFWLDRGVDGFRVDTVGLYSKPQDFPDAKVRDPTQKWQVPQDEVRNGPRIHEFLREQRRNALDPYGDVPLVGELGFCSKEDLVKYLSLEHRELDMVFDFSVVAPQGSPGNEGGDTKSKYTLPYVRKGFAYPQNVLDELDLWPTVFLENHDNPRSISRWGPSDPALLPTFGKSLALLLGMLSGTLFIFQGQEFGMENLPVDWPLTELRDITAITRFEDLIRKYPGDMKKLQEAKEEFQYWGRDHARTPVQWTSEEPAAGFSKVKPWMKANPSFRYGVDAKEEASDPNSILNFWKKVIAMRSAKPDLYVYGTTGFLDKDNADVLYMTKKLHHGKKPCVLGVISFSDQAKVLHWPTELKGVRLGKLLLETGISTNSGQLGPREGRLYELL